MQASSHALELVTVIALQGAQEMPLLADVIEPREPDITVLPEARGGSVAPMVRRRALGLEVAATAKRERLDGAAVARALDEHYSAQLHD